MYCSHCWADGRFTMPNLTVKQMQTRVSGKMREMRIPGFMHWMFTRRIPKLERWTAASR